MKIVHVIMIIIVVLLLASCANAELFYRLSEDNTVHLKYMFELESVDQEVEGYAQTIMAYWENQGLNTQVDDNENTIRINGNRAIESDTKNLAAESFADILASKDSLFKNVQFEYSPSYEVDDYSLEAVVDLKDVIRQSEAQNIPDDEVKRLMTGAKNGTYIMSISLPGEIVSTNANTTENGICTWQLSYGETTNIFIHTSLRNDENISVYTGLKNDLNTSNTLFLICCIVACVCVLAILIYFAVRRYLRIRASKVRVKKFR